MWRAIRGLRGQRFGVTAIVLLLAVAIGATAAVLTVVDALVLHPLPSRVQDRLVHLVGLALEPAGEDGVAWWRQAPSLDAIATYASTPALMDGDTAGDSDAVRGGSGGGQAGRRAVRATVVAADFFRVFAITPAPGRDFVRDDEQPGHARVAIVSDALWRALRRERTGLRGDGAFDTDAAAGTAADADAIADATSAAMPGSLSVRLNRQRYDIIGVAPAGFDFPRATDVWIVRDAAVPTVGLTRGREPLGVPAYGPPEGWVGRLKENATIDGVRAELYTLLARLQARYAGKTTTRFGSIIDVRPLRRELTRAIGPTLVALLAGTALVLSIAVASAGLFFLGRSAQRRRELAIRQACGASPGRLLRELLLETTLVCAMGGLLGALLALAALSLLASWLPDFIVHLPRHTRVMAAVIAGATGLSLLAGLLAALPSSTAVLANDVVRELQASKGAPGPLGRARLRRTLLVAQVAVALVLTIDAGLLIRSFLRMTSVPRGVIETQALTGEAMATREITSDASRLRVLQTALLNEVATLPGIAHAGIASHSPIAGPEGGLYVTRDGQPPPSPQHQTFAFMTLVSGDYFAAAGIPLLAGRPFVSADTHAIIISRTLASALAAGANGSTKSPSVTNSSATSGRATDSAGLPALLGTRISLGEDQPREIVGIVDDTLGADLDDGARAHVYLPYHAPANGVLPRSAMHVIARCAGPCVTPSSSLARRMAAVAGVDVGATLPIEAMVARVEAPAKARAILLAAYAALGVAIALAGLAALTAYLAAQRAYEMGVRMSLGTAPRDVAALVVREGTLAIAGGLLLGVPLAVTTSRLFAGVLFGVTPLDASSFTTALLTLPAAGLAACLLPALRLARTGPAALLRRE